MDKLNPIADSINVQNKRNIKRAGDDLFQNSLDQAIKRQEGTAPQNAAARLSEPMAMTFHKIEAPAQTVVDQTDHLLDLLDDYTEKLGKPGTTLRDMAPLMDKLEVDANNLLQTAERNPDADESLKQIVSEAALTVRMELIKFRRGDYI